MSTENVEIKYCCMFEMSEKELEKYFYCIYENAKKWE